MPAGPPVCALPHNLGHEAAQWVDEKLEAEVARGQLVRGNSAWGSPPFPTKESGGDHQKKRKRRLVVDYRRVNARVARSVYYCKRITDVLSEVAGSAWYTFVDAVTGFNQVVNTRRARKVLAIVARSGKFLPVCLTFGLTNGPDDFSYIVDRMYAPGRSRRMRLGREWLVYVDDLTVRSGRVVDGVAMRDNEYDAEVTDACKRVHPVPPQTPQEALEAFGFDPSGLGDECEARKTRRKYDARDADRNHPFAHAYARTYAHVAAHPVRARTLCCVVLVVSFFRFPLSQFFPRPAEAFWLRGLELRSLFSRGREKHLENFLRGGPLCTLSRPSSAMGGGGKGKRRKGKFKGKGKSLRNRSAKDCSSCPS